MSKREIWRTVFVVEVLSEGAAFFPAGGDNDPFGLKDIAHAITEGDCIGAIDVDLVEQVPEDMVIVKLLDIGNDGSFFGPIDEEDFDEED